MSLYQYFQNSKPVDLTSNVQEFYVFFFRLQEAKSSFFQRQFSSALKLFRNLLSWEGILSDSALKEIAISCLLNRYLLSAIRVSGFVLVFYFDIY